MKKESINLNRTQKILLTLYELSKGKNKDIRYENIVVELFKRYPKEFHLKGYPEYPDSGDGPQRILYEEKKRGNVLCGNKYFKLTPKGFATVESLKAQLKGKSINEKERISAYTQNEINRISTLNGFNLFLRGELDKIFDNDFYNYLGVTVRSERSDFKGRIRALSDIVKELELLNIENDIKYKKIVEYHKFLEEKFKDILNFKLTN